MIPNAALTRLLNGADMTFKELQEFEREEQGWQRTHNNQLGGNMKRQPADFAASVRHARKHDRHWDAAVVRNATAQQREQLIFALVDGWGVEDIRKRMAHVLKRQRVIHQRSAAVERRGIALSKARDAALNKALDRAFAPMKQNAGLRH